ncbi:MAG: succinate dehydrogenase assembly factor 2 [Rhodobacteraceae bacterium]|nr:succinate dehydrogenase assembly factor 2 [Paracoccaceae bacterium]
MSEAPEARLKRLRMRSMRRGIKEMDIILMRYAEARLAQMNEAQLVLYDALLSENDQDLYQWVTGQVPAPEKFGTLVDEIASVATGGPV